MKYPNLPKWQIITLPVAAIILAVFYFGKYYVAGELIDAHDQIQTLEHNLQAALEMVQTEKARGAIATQEVDVVRGANAILRGSERQRQDKIARLQADLAFYRRLGGASGSQAALAVHHVELEPTRAPRVYRIIVTLTQNLRWASAITGRIELGVDGIEQEVARHLGESQLLAESADVLRFQFKYFQQLEQLITLPEGFEPLNLTVRLKSASLRTPIEESMEWHSLFDQVLSATS